MSNITKGLTEAFGRYDRRDAYQRDYDSSVAGMGKRQSQAYQADGGANDEGWDEPQRDYTPKPVAKKGFYFYKVPADQDAKAQEVGLFRTKSGKWYSPFQNTRADMFFGPGKYWEPKTNESQLSELSNDTLASYKKKAGDDAIQADKRGDYARGDKRMSGIIKATKKEFDNDAKGVAEGSLNEFAPDGFNGGDDGEGFSPEIAKMAQDDGFTKGVSLADGATLERAMAINYWHSQHGGMYKQYFAQGFKEGRLNKIKHDNKQYNLNLKLMKDGSIRHGEQGVAEGSTEQVYKVLAVDKSNALSKQVKLKVKASSLDEVFERLAINDWYPLEINGVEVINGKRLKQDVAEGAAFDKWADDRAASQLYKLKPATEWTVSYDYGPHMSKTVTVKAGSEEEARDKVEKAAEKKGMSIMINSVEQGVAEGIMNTIANKVMGAAPEQPKYQVGQRVKYETSPHQPDWKDGGRGVGVITAYKNGHYMINDNPVNHFEIKGVVDQDVAEEKQRLDPSCWKGYKKQGTKMKGDTRVNNCVPVKESAIMKGLK